MERVGGIEPPSIAWKAIVLPLNYTRRIVAAMRHIKNFIMVCFFYIYYIIFFQYNQIIKMVESRGIEPLTSCVQGRRSPS